MLKQQRCRTLLASLAVAGICGGFIPAASAALSGSCGAVFVLPHNYVLGSMSGTMNSTTGAYNGSLQLQSPGQTADLDVLAVLNFTASTISFNVVSVTFGSPDKYSAQSGTVPFTTMPGPVPNSYTISFTPTGGSKLVGINLLPVNSGSTILLQATGSAQSAFTGVCQAL